MNIDAFYRGEAFDAYKFFGAHVGADGVSFRTYAPQAFAITLIGEFNGWQEQPLSHTAQSGVWSVTVADAKPGQMYRYVVYGRNGRVEHCDPYGFGMELRPGACSVIRDLHSYSFSDASWMRNRTKCLDKPLNIYELHLGSWKMSDGQWCLYNEIADSLISYLKEHGYQYVEFMPLSEHPFDGSWGYQNTGFFAPTSRYGDMDALKALIDKLHHARIGAIMDFVPVHFAVDAYGLQQFDGTSLYEYPHMDVRKSEWGSFNFNHARGEVASFVQSAANYWLTEFHFDGLRMDAVSRLIYWQGDEKRGENGAVVNFLKMMNKGLHALHPTAMLIAEDSTAYPGVTKDVDAGGLGFDYKWDLGWMHDTLEYMQAHPSDRRAMGQKITFSILYTWQERFILPLSHDEVVHGKKTIIDKLYGTYEQKFAQCKLLYLYMMTHPGKKLNFMGNELAMFREWDERRELDWDILKMPAHDSFHHFITDLNRLYGKEKALWEQDGSYEGFRWVDGVSENPCVFAYTRLAELGKTLIILNFSDTSAQIIPPCVGKAIELLDSDWECYGGSTRKSNLRHIPKSIVPFGAMIFRLHG